MTAAPALRPVQSTAAGAVSPVLTGAHARAHLDGLLFEVRLTQDYCNTGSEALELQYSFPLPAGATLLGLVVDWNGRRLEGRVLAKPDAEQRYEKALEEGDSPVLVRDNGHGLYTAQLGNLLPGEKASLELHFAEPVRPEQGRLRLSLPTTLTERYGDPHQPGGLPVYVNAPSSPLVRYPFSVEVEISGPAAQARIHSPSHPVTLQMTPNGVRSALQGEGSLDRDFVLLLEDLPALNSALHAADGEQTLVMASFLAPAHGFAPAALRLKLLVDCSGSMAGDSIVLARAALASLIPHLGARDRVSLSLFGNHTVHPLPILASCDAAHLRALEDAVSRIAADLGGTELEGALTQTYGVLDGDGESKDADILLITDGAVWRIDQIVATARRGHQRIFAIGVGSAPSESLLRALAERTGGACELVGPNESMEGVIRRHLDRLRGPRGTGLRVDWGAARGWQSLPPTQIFAGDTVHLFAGLASPPARAPELRWMAGPESFSARAELQSVSTDLVARLAAARRCAECGQPAEALSLALRHQLVTPQTHLFLVHERAAQAKGDGLPTLHEVTAMLAAGSHGMGVISANASRTPPEFMRSARSADVAETRFASRSKVVRSTDLSRQASEGASASMESAFEAFLTGGADLIDVPGDTPLREAPPAATLSPLEFVDGFRALAAKTDLASDPGALAGAVPDGCLPHHVPGVLMAHGPADGGQQLALLCLALEMHFYGRTATAQQIALQLMSAGIADPWQAARMLLDGFFGLTDESWGDSPA